jgi:tetratricopeptide (TPR) repeat protein
MKKCLSLLVKAGDKRAEVEMLASIGMAYSDNGEQETALSYLQKSLALSRNNDFEEQTGNALIGLGLVYRKVENYDEAIDCLTKGALLLQPLGRPEIEAETSYVLACIYVDRGDYAEGLSLFLELLPEIHQSGDLKLEGDALGYMAIACRELGDPDSAIRYLKKSLSIQKTLGDKEEEGNVLLKLAEIRKYHPGNRDKISLVRKKK